MNRSHGSCVLRRLTRMAASAALSSALVSPALAAPGPHLSWSHCWADGQVSNRSFACDSNAGTDFLYVSYESPVATGADRVGVEMTLHLTAAGGVFPAWWEVAGGTQCRGTALTTAEVGDPVSACADPFQGVGAGGAAMQLGTEGPGTARIRAVSAVPSGSEFALQTGTEYFAIRMAISHVKTTGTGACGGCSTPVCIGAGIITVVGITGSYDVQMTAGVTASSDAYVGWQGAYTKSYQVSFEGTGYYANLQCEASAPQPTRRTTWAGVKAAWR